MSAVKIRQPRQFLVPGGDGGTMTLDDMELFEHSDSSLGEWARRVLAIEREKTLDEIGADRLLPRGVIDPTVEGGILVASLVNRSGQVWQGTSWGWPEAPVDMDDTIDMDEAAVAFVARAQMEGANAVLFRDPLPLGIIGAGDGAKPAGAIDPPANSVMVAIVDAFDKNAVLELVAVAPGPRIHRRHDGQWFEDTAWVDVFKSVKPPPMVKLEEAMLASVVSQVDSATAGEPFQPFKADDRGKYMVASSAYLEELAAESDAAMIASNLALVAVAGKNLSPKDMKNTEQLRRYWLYGKGAAKIRWGTKGSWTRCYKNLVKYLGPMTPGYCTNMSQRLGGQGVATHVGD